MTFIDAATLTIGAGGTGHTPGVNNYPGAAGVRVLVRTPDTGVLVGNGGVSGLSTGYELTANVEYVFDLYGVPLLSAGSSDYELTFKNINGGSSVTVSYIATALR
jgi:hypothetical protein